MTLPTSAPLREPFRDFHFDASDYADGAYVDGLYTRSGHKLTDMNASKTPGNANPGTFQFTTVSGTRLLGSAPTGNPPGAYLLTDLGAVPRSITAKFRMSGATPAGDLAGGITFILSKGIGGHSAQIQGGGAFNDMLHIVFGPGQVDFEYFQDGDSFNQSLSLFTYPGGELALDGTTEYTAGIAIDQDILTATCPDGSVVKFWDAHIRQVAGRYMIYQHYQSVTTDLQVKTRTIDAIVTAR